MAATAWDMVSEKRKASSRSASENGLSRAPSSAAGAEDPLVPQTTRPGAKFGGFGFGKQGEKKAADRGFKISRPMESLPRMSCRFG